MIRKFFEDTDWLLGWAYSLLWTVPLGALLLVGLEGYVHYTEGLNTDGTIIKLFGYVGSYALSAFLGAVMLSMISGLTCLIAFGIGLFSKEQQE